jgi:hypothetical protein
MDKIFTRIHDFLVSLFEDPAPADPVSLMSPRELADLPVHHPRT